MQSQGNQGIGYILWNMKYTAKMLLVVSTLNSLDLILQKVHRESQWETLDATRCSVDSLNFSKHTGYSISAYVDWTWVRSIVVFLLVTISIKSHSRRTKKQLSIT